MVWDPIWEKIYKMKKWGKYPSEELVRFIAKSYYSVKNRSKIKILEVGCGIGANLWYLAREEFSVCGIDGSKSAIKETKKRFKKEGLRGKFIIGEMSQLPWSDNTFDCVVDIASLACNNESETQIIVDEIFRVLKPKGKHFSITPKKGCWGDQTGVRIDSTSFTNIQEGPFKDIGLVRFASLNSLRRLYSKYNNLEIEYSLRTDNCRLNKIQHWVLTCIK